jgi:hypothetical protein
MIECIFTLDYEIYGNGTGALKELVYEPAERLRLIFHKWNARFVNFVEVAEFEKIEAHGTDSAIEFVRKQIRELYQDGFEIGLHLHPQWCNARYGDGQWLLDLSEYNLCTLPRNRIAQILEGSLNYLRYIVDQPDFTPLSFRAGNWLFQPTQTAANVLAENGIRIDSSVFKGGLQHKHKLDYRPAMKNGYYWRFAADVNEPDPVGSWLEVPIHTDMVPFWKMVTTKRVGLGNTVGAGQGAKHRLNRAFDFLRFRYPMKLDFCRMTLKELTSMMGKIIREDQQEPESCRPVVAIGHTKDLHDIETVDSFLSFLRTNGIAVSTFNSVYPKLWRETCAGRTR